MSIQSAESSLIRFQTELARPNEIFQYIALLAQDFTLTSSYFSTIRSRSGRMVLNVGCSDRGEITRLRGSVRGWRSHVMVVVRMRVVVASIRTLGRGGNVYRGRRCRRRRRRRMLILCRNRLLRAAGGGCRRRRSYRTRTTAAADIADAAGANWRGFHNHILCKKKKEY